MTIVLDLDEFEVACLEQLISKACEVSSETEPGFETFVNILTQIKSNFVPVENLS